MSLYTMPKIQLLGCFGKRLFPQSVWQNSELSHFGVAWKALAFVAFDYKGLRDYLGPGQNYYVFFLFLWIEASENKL